MIELKTQPLRLSQRCIFVVLQIFFLVHLHTNISFAKPAALNETKFLSFEKTAIIGHLNFPPMIYADESGESAGPVADLIRLILDTYKIYPEYKLVTLPTKRIITYLIEGKIPFSPLIQGIPALKDKVIYSDSIILTLQINIYYIGEEENIRDLSGLKGKRVIGLRGYSYGGRIRSFIDDPANKVIYYLCNTHQSGFRMLQSGRGDYLIDFQSPSEIVLKQRKIDNLHCIGLETIDVYFNISKNIPDYLKLKKQLDLALGALHEQGKLNHLIHERKCLNK